MTLLLDTHVWLWALTNPGKIRRRCLDMMAAAELSLSEASLYEAGIKIWRRRMPGVAPLDTLVAESERQKIRLLPVERAQWEAAALLDWPHLDPFDRLLAATARARGATLVTADQRILGWDGVKTLRAA